MTKIATDINYNLSTINDFRYSHQQRLLLKSDNTQLDHLFSVACQQSSPKFFSRLKWIKVKKEDQVFYLNISSLKNEWDIPLVKILVAKLKKDGAQKLIHETIKDSEKDLIKNRIYRCANKSMLTKAQLKTLTKYIHSISAEIQKEFKEDKSIEFIRVKSKEVQKLTGVKRTITFLKNECYVQNEPESFLGEGTTKKAKYAYEIFGQDKTFLVSKVKDENDLSNKVTEATLLLTLKKNSRSVQTDHVFYYESSKGESKQLIIMDNYAGGDLTQYLERNEVSYEKRVVMVKQMAEALIQLHNQKLIHKDVKTENFLVDDKGNIFLSDYGYTSPKEDETFLHAGSYQFHAPEVIGPHEQDPSQDMWSFGVVCHKLLVNGGPHWLRLKNDSQYHLYRSAITDAHYLPVIVDPADPMEVLIWEMLSQDPDDRPTAEEFLSRVNSIFPD